MDDQLPAVKTLAAEPVSQGLASAVMAALAVDAKRRPSSVEEWRRRLGAALSPAKSTLPVAKDRLWELAMSGVRHLRRSRRLRGGLAVVLIVAFTLLLRVASTTRSTDAEAGLTTNEDVIMDKADGLLRSSMTKFSKGSSGQATADFVASYVELQKIGRDLRPDDVERVFNGTEWGRAIATMSDPQTLAFLPEARRKELLDLLPKALIVEGWVNAMIRELPF